jgi:hypothetical protein
MEWTLDQGDRVRYHGIGDDRERLGTVRKALHILTAQHDEVPVYIVGADEGDPVIVGDGEILEKLPPGTPGPRSHGEGGRG